MKFIAFFVFGAASARAVHSPQQQQVPILGEAVEDVSSQPSEATEDAAPGIGVHFTNSYAIASARYQNGTTRDLVKVEGDAQYIELMTRWMNTRQGSSLPISRDAVTLSNFLHTLQIDVEEVLGSPMTNFAPAIFPLDTAKKQYFQDALDLAGLSSTRTRTGNNLVVYEDTNAAYAGLDYGLCKNWTEYQDCLDEQSKLPYLDVLFLSFDNGSFSAIVKTLQSVFQEWPIHNHAFNLDLGWWNLPIHEVPRAKFWADIHEMVVDSISWLSRPPSRIVLMGAHGADKEFSAVVEAALWSVLEVDVNMMMQANKAEDSASLAARGAAEMAWRSQSWNRKSRETTIADGTPTEHQ
ncbi:uncharacterized protein K460DRAFT_370827 [Cucurbitaria berberidis CBS 394.84]|uniref:Uncharacterized protein n=1 Tax=Cucurbitaria berberidis CBS 394.84 TaxID=1168544 RepID=A0A9P4L3E7_9PLEO|nr:uncharacterized protein K460DRAFT_370827 [Cucurbitaria berberidis CBS 394.84]KAF1840846.1 hypothetical protein K460DRAFT_370827 [Cucurbitaria berberidis CBS 394.84]